MALLRRANSGDDCLVVKRAATRDLGPVAAEPFLNQFNECGGGARSSAAAYFVLCVAMQARDEQKQPKPYGVFHKHPYRREGGNP